jgi:threonine/homoserine/homoserine lactone efflux protein
MRSPWEFLLVALVVTLTPGPATALVLRVAARDGRAAAMRSVLGNSVGVLMWAALSAVGVSALIVASQLAYDALRVGGAVVLIVIGARSLLRRRDDAARLPARPAGWRTGVVTGIANPKLAVFFVALFPQFLARDAAVLPAALAMGAVIVLLDLAWFGLLSWAVERAGALLRPRVRRGVERATGAAMVGFGVSLAVEAR